MFILVGKIRSIRKWAALGLAGSFLLACAGCSGIGADRMSAGGSAAAPAAGGAASGQGDVAGAAGQVQLQTLVPGGLTQQWQTSQTPQGFYYIEPNPQDSLTGTIRYIDYTAGLDVPLSTQVNSTHDTADDPAYLDSIIGDYRVFVWQDQLYFMRMGACDYIDGSEFGQLAASGVWQMEPDGTNRRQIYQGGSAEDLVMWAAASADDLYLMRSDNTLLRVPLEGGEAQIVATLPAWGRAVGCSGQLVYLWGWDDSSETLTTVDVVSGEVSQLLTLSTSAKSWVEPCVVGDTLFLIDKGPEPRIDLCGLDGTVRESIPLKEYLVGDVSVSLDNDATVIGNTVCIALWNHDTKQGMNAVVDAASGTVSISPVCLTQDNGKDAVAAMVVAESAEDYLVITGIYEADAQMPQGDGTSLTVQTQRYAYSLIPKDEFCTQSPTLRPIQRVD